jgi:hypothetical protein
MKISSSLPIPLPPSIITDEWCAILENGESFRGFTPQIPERKAGASPYALTGKGRRGGHSMVYFGGNPTASHIAITTDGRTIAFPKLQNPQDKERIMHETHKKIQGVITKVISL